MAKMVMRIEDSESDLIIERQGDMTKTLYQRIGRSGTRITLERVMKLCGVVYAMARSIPAAPAKASRGEE